MPNDKLTGGYEAQLNSHPVQRFVSWVYGFDKNEIRNAKITETINTTKKPTNLPWK